MTKQRILIINGHPDPLRGHFLDGLIQAYTDGATRAGHAVSLLRVADLDFPLLRSKTEWETGRTCPDIARAQEMLREADHILLCYPLWLGTLPALLKGFLEQVLRPGFAFGSDDLHVTNKGLKGKSARVLVTMGMPVLVYRWYFGAHSLFNLKRNILGFCGISPIRQTMVGMVEGSAKRRVKALGKLERLGFAGK